MTWASNLFSNPFLLIPLSSWAIAQVLKVFINAAVTRTWDLHRLFGDGGMPSGHSATVASLAVSAALHYGMGVRLETGKQAALLNDIVEAFNRLSAKELPAEQLKEFVGHTPLQVCAGVLIGILNAVFLYPRFF